MSPRKFFSNSGRGKLSGVPKVQAVAQEAVEVQRKQSHDSTSSTEDGVLSRGSTKVQSTRSGSMRSPSTSREHSPSWTSRPFSWGRSKASVRDRRIGDKCQEAAGERAKPAMDKKEQKRNEKGKRQWPEHLEWFYGANMPGYWVI